MCGSFIVVTTVAIACFICIFKLRNSHVKVNTPAVDYETPNLVFQNNFHLSTDSVVTSPIFESQLERIVTAYELPRMIPSSQPYYLDEGDTYAPLFCSRQQEYGCEEGIIRGNS